MNDADDESRSERFFGRCSLEQKRLWERAARLDKRPLSDWLRTIADEAAARTLGTPGPDQVIKPDAISITAEQLAAMLSASREEGRKEIERVSKSKKK